MLDHIDWQQAVHDPRFWAMRYEWQFPGVSDEDSDVYFSDFYNLEQLEDDPLLGYAGEGDDSQFAELEVGWRTLSFLFPENYRWEMVLMTEEGHASGIYHSLFHPNLYPGGINLAEEGGHAKLPGLRWTELKQIATCLTQNWQSDFNVRAIIPLLYPVVEPITFDDLQDVRQTLAAAWQDLNVLDAIQADSWLDEKIEVYDKGRVWRFKSHKEWKPLSYNLDFEGELWVQAGEEGWQTFHPGSRRHVKKDSRQFLPFFSMLERYS